MRTLSLAAIFALAAIPVSAQQADQQKNRSPVEQMEQQSRQVQTQSERQNHQPGAQSAMSQQKLRSALEAAGFTQINIIDSAYLVRAQTEDGNNVVLYIDPPAAGQQSDAGLPEGSFKTDSIRRAEQDKSGSN